MNRFLFIYFFIEYGIKYKSFIIFIYQSPKHNHGYKGIPYGTFS